MSQDDAYWSANCNVAYGALCDAFSPSGTLVKALLINSGEAMDKYASVTGAVLPTQSLGPPPDY